MPPRYRGGLSPLIAESVRPTIYGPGLGHTLPARVLGYEKGGPELRFIADSSPRVRVHTGRGDTYRVLISFL
jgi:hypothetical protein